ncbi:MAG: hypothetical protein HY827_05265 [Actinobacteria bacterium]|nr:hypothetical protein [Actinomycetota bacterium]
MPDAETGTTTNTTVSEPSRGGRGGSLPLVLVLIGAVGFSASLTAVYSGMRDLMYSGGACASGGPYAIQNECTGGQVSLLVGGIFAMLIFGGILAAASSRYGGASFLGAGLLMWATLFGALGFNFMQLGFNPPAHMSGASGWIISGVVFWLMALGGLIPGLTEVKSFLARGDSPEPSMFKAPLVRAKVPVQPMPGFPHGFPGSPAPAPGDQSGEATHPRPVASPEAASPDVDSGPAVADDTFVDPVTGERVKRDR